MTPNTCSHLDAYSETGRTLGGHRELLCDDCGARFVSRLAPEGTTRVGIVERERRGFAYVRFGNPRGESAVYSMRIEPRKVAQ